MNDEWWFKERIDEKTKEAEVIVDGRAKQL